MTLDKGSPNDEVIRVNTFSLNTFNPLRISCWKPSPPFSRKSPENIITSIPFSIFISDKAFIMYSNTCSACLSLSPFKWKSDKCNILRDLSILIFRNFNAKKHLSCVLDFSKKQLRNIIVR